MINNGELSGYNIYYLDWLGEPVFDNVTTDNATKVQITIDDLTPATNYIFEVYTLSYELVSRNSTSVNATTGKSLISIYIFLKLLAH